ncbi:MAG: hypothetical protein O7H41_05020 [Planctomycetota bacterium]|nr:hypothetical protein [Planctomycetota bacterium]
MKPVPILSGLLAGLIAVLPVSAQETTPTDADVFLRYLERERPYPEKSIIQLKSVWDPRGSEDAIQDALRALDPAYRAAMDAFEAGQDEEAQKAADRIVESGANPYVTAYAQILQAKLLLVTEQMEPALKILDDLWAKSLERISADHEVKFYIAFARSRIYERDKAIEAFQAFLAEFPDAPERYRTMARQELRALLMEGVNPLLDVAGRMGEIKTMLRKENTGRPTQDKQGQVISILDELIKLLEEMEKQGSGSGSGSGRGRGGRPSGNRQSNSPAQNSALPQGPGRVGPLRRISRGKSGEAWGDLKGKEREEVLQAMKGKFPARYRALLEQYYKALSEQP